jgi:hypothetical protein
VLRTTAELERVVTIVVANERQVGAGWTPKQGAENRNRD